VISVLGVLPALLLDRGGMHAVSSVLCAEATSPLHHIWRSLRYLPLVLTDPALADYCLEVNKRFAAPVFVLCFTFVRFIVYPIFYPDYLSFYFRRLSNTLWPSQHSKTAKDKRAADEVSYEHPDLGKTEAIAHPVPPQIPLVVSTSWAVLPALILYGSANFILENREYLVLPDPSVFFS
jgi:hypothetical protein